MMQTEMHTQVRMERNGSIQVAFIPSKFAERGRRVRLKQDGGTWEDGWVVVATYSSLPSATVAKNERNYMSHRRGTDI